MEIREYLEKLRASDTDLLLLQDSNDGLFKHITKANLVAGLSSGSGSGSSLWQLKSGDYTVVHGDKILVDISANSWTLSLPTLPTFGTEIELYLIAKTSANKLNVNLQGEKLRSQSPKSVSCDVLYAYTKLIYVNEFIGWLDTNNILSLGGTYPFEILKDSPYVYLRLNDLSGTKALDSSSNNRDCQYQGTITYQQESSLPSEPDNKSIKFNDSTSRIIVNPQITAPNPFVLECRFKTLSTTGGMFGFDNGSSYDKDVYLENGKIKFLNFNGATLLSPNTYNDNNWHTVSATVCSRGTELWVDGVLVASSTNTNTQQYTANWYIGWGRYGNYFNGLIDEASITHSQLSADRIKQRHSFAN